MSKRKKFAITTIILALGLLAIRLPFLQWRFRVVGFGMASWLLSVWAVYDRDFTGIKWGTLTILPASFALAGALVFPLLPPSFDSFIIWPISYDLGLIFALGARMLFVMAFAVGYYAVLLTENIYNVSAERTIQLLRAAHSVGFIMALISALCFYLVLASFHLGSLVNFSAVTVISWLLIFPTVWAVNLSERVGEKERNLTVFMGLIIGEIAWALSFWPIQSAVFALFLTSVFYIVVGISQYFLSERLFGTTVREFIIVSSVVFLLIVLTTNWMA